MSADARRRRARTRRRRRRPAAGRRQAPTAGERRLLTLARDLTTLAESVPRARLLDETLHRLGPTGGAPARRDKGRALAMAWAREQARLALEDILEKSVQAGVVRADLPTPVLAWLLLTAAEALVDDLPEAASDRLQALARLLAPAPPAR